MSKGIINAAYYEAGHVLALLLATRRFKYVTIVPENMKDGYGIETSVHIRGIPSEIKNQIGKFHHSLNQLNSIDFLETIL